MYHLSSDSENRRCVYVPMGSEFDFRVDDYISAIDDSIRIIFLTNPHSPTGKLMPLEDVCRICRAAENRLVVLDEAYYDFSGLTFLEQMKDHNNLVILRSLSKIGLAGLRVGYGIFPSILADEINKIRMPYNSNSISQIAAEELLNNFSLVQNQIDSIKNERTRLLKELSKIESISTFPSDANFILFQAASKGEMVFNNLMEYGILIRNLGTHPMLKNCLRVTIGTEAENDQFLERLKQIIK